MLKLACLCFVFVLVQLFIRDCNIYLFILFLVYSKTILWTLINEYTDWSRPSEHPINLLDSTIDILGDALVVAPLIESMELFAKSFTMVTNNNHNHNNGRQSSFDFAYRDPSSSNSSGSNRVYFYVFQNQVSIRKPKHKPSRVKATLTVFAEFAFLC